MAIHFLPAALRRRFRALAQKRTLLPLFLMLLGLALAFYVALGG